MSNVKYKIRNLPFFLQQGNILLSLAPYPFPRSCPWGNQGLAVWVQHQGLFSKKRKHCFIHLWITGNIKIVALPISAARIYIYAQSAHPDNNFWCLNFWIKVWHILHWEKNHVWLPKKWSLSGGEGENWFYYFRSILGPTISSCSGWFFERTHS